jgi:predicted nucleic-acid-binding Zn-ribbon protein
MGLFKSKQPVTATIADRALVCLVCGHGQFWDQEVKLNTSGMEFLDLGWANQSALGLICASCGYVHEFAGDVVKLWELPRS